MVMHYGITGDMHYGDGDWCDACEVDSLTDAAYYEYEDEFYGVEHE